jgi:uncharacterized protein
MSEFSRKENHLKGQTSPYLLQHLYNPVDWHPWGNDALQKAKSENKPLLISIGYSACHWCHVMERESFENQEVARLMNQYFVCIKVDREERPDIDHLYMGAVQLISGQGGWPLNCFALPDGRPFWGGTYFPAEQWKNILSRIHDLYLHQYSELEEQAKRLTEGIANNNLLPVGENVSESFPAATTHAMVQSILQSLDTTDGGTKGAPKFPLPVIYEFLLHYYYQNPNATQVLEAINITLKKMAMGGIYDQAGGGFSRYSVDEYWKVPHFEKMLYDNAQLINLYAKAWKINSQPLFKQVVEETIEFVKRELTSPEGTFYSALDADSEGEEGKFYVWTENEIRQVLGHDAALAIEYFNVGGNGFWENGRNILLLTQSADEFALEKGIEIKSFYEMANRWKHLLLTHREKRTRPGLDYKILISWNALMIEALAEAAAAFQNDQWKEMAVKAADFIIDHAMDPRGMIHHTLHHKTPAIDGFLEDYAFLIKALIKLGQVCCQEKYFILSHKLAEYSMENFSSSETPLLSFSSSQGEKLAAPHFEFEDNVIPSSNSTMARNLFYLGNIFEDKNWVDKSREMLKAIEPQMERYGSWAANWGILWLHFQKEFYTLAVCGEGAQTTTQQIMTHYLPDALVCTALKPASQLPVLENRFSPDKTMIYPCTLHSCLTPEESVDGLINLL